MTKKLLSAKNEKLACFDDLKREIEQKKNDLRKTDDDRKALHAKIEENVVHHNLNLESSSAKNDELIAKLD